MKKAYATPVIVTNGDVVENTHGPTGLPETAGHTGPGQAIGSVGFHL